MRITNSMMVNQFLSDANDSLGRVSKYQGEVDSTKRVTNISDDPQATLTALRARNKLSSLGMYQENITTAKSYFNEAESADDELNKILQTVYQKVVDASAPGKNGSDFSDISDELKSLQSEVVSIGNTTVGTTYLFGGFNFTGTIDGAGKKTAPFSVNASGHLVYNGIDLTQLSCLDDYKGQTSQMSDCATTLQADGTALAGTSSDEYAKNTVCAEAMKSVKSLISDGKYALSAAKQFGIDTNASAGYKKLSDFISSLSGLSDKLSNECSKKLAGNYVLTSDPSIHLTGDGSIDYKYYKDNGISVMTDDEYKNCFSLTDARNIVGQINELIGNTDPTDGVGLNYSMSEANSALQGEMDSVLTASGAKEALKAETGNKATIPIGEGVSIDYTFTGLDLLGNGKKNIYYALGKCISMLDTGDTDGLKGMISSLQDAQGSVLNMQTTIGATENRLDLINDRYNTSKSNYTEMRSNAVDADMAEAITDLMTAKTVYNAALAGGAEIVKTSLLDFLH